MRQEQGESRALFSKSDSHSRYLAKFDPVPQFYESQNVCFNSIWKEKINFFDSTTLKKLKFNNFVILNKILNKEKRNYT